MMTMRKLQKEISNMLKYGFAITMGVWFSILLFVWVAQLW